MSMSKDQAAAALAERYRMALKKFSEDPNCTARQLANMLAQDACDTAERLARACEGRMLTIVEPIAKQMASVLAQNPDADVEFIIDLQPPPPPWEAAVTEDE